MASSRFAIALFLGGTLLTFASIAESAPADATTTTATTTISDNLAGFNGRDDVNENFKTFSSNLLMESDLDEFSIEKGAAISSPFGVGYMLANINDQVWNVSNQGISQVLKSPKEQISAQYASLLDKLHKVGGTLTLL